WPKSEGGIPAGYDPAAGENRRKAMIAEARATFGLYRLRTDSEERVHFTPKAYDPRRAKRLGIDRDSGWWQGRLDHAEAKRLEGLGVKVEALDDPTFESDLAFYAS